MNIACRSLYSGRAEAEDDANDRHPKSHPRYSGTPCRCSGEQSKTNFSNYARERLSGFAVRDYPPGGVADDSSTLDKVVPGEPDIDYLEGER